MPYTEGRPVFPDPFRASRDGLVAWGGNLEPPTLIAAYASGIFPWYSQNEPILWWSPDPRCVMRIDDFRISSRSRRKIRSSGFSFSLDSQFEAVIEHCSYPRKKQDGTWILPEIKDAYARLHRFGYAHSVEVWKDGRLAGGLYGVALGKVFFGESMFRTENEGSRCALACLAALMRARGMVLLDCQQASPHMLAMGAREIPRSKFMAELRRLEGCGPAAQSWRGMEEEALEHDVLADLRVSSAAI